MFGRSYRLPFTLLGIPLHLDISFLLILPILAFIIGARVGDIAAMFGIEAVGPLMQGWMRFILGLVAALGLFACVVLHELGHAVTARRYDVKVRSITLWFLGGVARFEEMPRQPGAEAVVAIAGPIVSIALGLLCLGIGMVFPTEWVAARFVFLYLGTLNIVLAVFNMIPALPLDGGRVLRSLLALKMPHLKATEVSARISKVFAVLLAIFGLLSINFFMLLIAVFIYLAVNAETSSTQIEELLRGLQVHDLMNPQVRTVPPEIRISELTQRMLDERHLGFPVVDDAGRLVGMITVDQVQGQDPATPVGAVMNKEVPTIREDADATEMFKRMSQDGFGRVVAVDDHNRMVGIVTKTDLMRLIQLRSITRDMVRWQQNHAETQRLMPGRPAWSR